MGQHDDQDLTQGWERAGLLPALRKQLGVLLHRDWS